MPTKMWPVNFKVTGQVVSIPTEAIGSVGYANTSGLMYGKRVRYVMNLLLSQGCAIEMFNCSPKGVWAIYFNISPDMEMEWLVVGEYISALETEALRKKILEVLQSVRNCYCSIMQLGVPNQVNNKAEKKRAAYVRRMLRRQMYGDLKSAEVLTKMRDDGNLTASQEKQLDDVFLCIEKKAFCFYAD